MEWRNRHALNGVLLYLVSTVFICYLSFNVRINQLNPITWNALFWIVILFASVNAVAKSFLAEKPGRQLYYYSLVSGQQLISARIIYNSLLLIVLALAGFIFYALILGNPVQDIGLYLLAIVLASVGLSSSLTLISAIAAKAGSNQSLVAVLGFPVILPILLMVIKLSKNAMDGLEWSSSYKELLVLMAINLIVGAVSYILFPYLWRS